MAKTKKTTKKSVLPKELFGIAYRYKGGRYSPFYTAGELHTSIDEAKRWIGENGYDSDDQFTIIYRAIPVAKVVPPTESIKIEEIKTEDAA